MSTIDITKYILDVEPNWRLYSLSDGNKVPIAQFMIPLEFDRDNVYITDGSITHFTAIKNCPCFRCNITQTVNNVVSWVTSLYINLSDPIFHFGKTTDLQSSKVTMLYLDGSEAIHSQQGLSASAVPEGRGVYCICATFTNNVSMMLGLLQSIGPIEYEEPCSESKKGILKSSNTTITYTLQSNLSQNTKDINLANHLVGNSTIYNENNPYPGGDEPSDDVTGTFSYTSDDNPIPELPTTSVTDSGLVTLYAPTESQLQALASYLWSDAFSLDSFKKLFNNPMDCILGLTMVPVNLPHGAAREITVGNIVSTVSCDVCSSQYVSVDCGTFKFSSSRFTGSFLDYSPYLKCYLYLPFIGTNEIDIDEWQNSTMRVVYHVDILTGAMFCFVTRDGKLVTTYSGQCAENVPLSSNDFSTTIGSILGVASTAVGAIATVATAGAAAPAAAAAKTAGTVAGAGLSTAVNVGHSKPSIRHGGGVGGGAGIMGKKYPYLVFIAPHMASPNDQNKYVGFPSNKIVQLSSCSGYTEVQAINLSIKAENITDKEHCTPSATDAEMDMIKSLLESGVIF